MKETLDKLNKAFESRVRLGIMSLLMVNEELEFNYLKKTMGLHDGTLASHIKKLESEEYIEVKKEFVGKKPKTTYKATPLGKKAFEEHLDALEKLLKGL